MTRGDKTRGPRVRPLLHDLPHHEAKALFEATRTDVPVVHKEDERQRLKQMEVALQSITQQATQVWAAHLPKAGPQAGGGSSSGSSTTFAT